MILETLVFLACVLVITYGQIRAARALLQWTQTDLAQKSGVSAPAITNIELEKQQPTIPTLEKIERALLQAGIAFGENDRVSIHKGSIFELKGKEGLKTLMDMIYEHCLKNPQDQVLVNNIRQEEYNKWAADFLNENRARMAAIPDKAPMRILQHEDDAQSNAPSYYEARYLKNNQFGSVGQYCFGSYVAFVYFDNTCQITVIDNPRLRESWALMYGELWRHAQKAGA